MSENIKMFQEINQRIEFGFKTLNHLITEGQSQDQFETGIRISPTLLKILKCILLGLLVSD